MPSAFTTQIALCWSSASRATNKLTLAPVRRPTATEDVIHELTARRDPTELRAVDIGQEGTDLAVRSLPHEDETLPSIGRELAGMSSPWHSTSICSNPLPSVERTQ